MTGAFSPNVGKLFSKLKLVTDNLLFEIAFFSMPFHVFIANQFKFMHAYFISSFTMHIRLAPFPPSSPLFVLLYSPVNPRWGGLRTRLRKVPRWLH